MNRSRTNLWRILSLLILVTLLLGNATPGYAQEDEGTLSAASTSAAIGNPALAAPDAPDTGNGVIAGTASGSANYSIPIQVPPGTNGLVPALSLNYSSQAGKSELLGHGWSYNQSYIEYQVLPRSGFVLILNGATHKLIQHQGAWKTKIFSDLRIQQLATTNQYQQYWLVTDGNGTQYRFGFVQDQSELACANRSRTTRMYLDLVTDINGNTITYEYAENPHPNDVGATYPTRIIYGSDSSRVIEFQYRDTDRTDTLVSYANHCATKYTRQIDRIITKASGQVVNRYRLAYFNIGQASMMYSVGIDGAGGQYYGSYTFEFFELANGLDGVNLNNDKWWNGYQNPNSVHYRIVDVDGDNRPDFVRNTNGEDITYYRNVGDRDTNGNSSTHGFEYNNPFTAHVGGGQVNEYVIYADFTADGKANYVRTWRNNNQTTWEIITSGLNTPVVRKQSTTGVDLLDSNVRLLDVNGDGSTDLFHSDPNESYKLKVCHHNGEAWTTCNQWRPATSQNIVANTDLRFVDLNTDGLLDIVYDHSVDGLLDVYWNTGDSWLTQAQQFPAPVRTNNERANFADFDGDGMIDISHTDYNNFGVYYGTSTGWNYGDHNNNNPNFHKWSTNIDYPDLQQVLDMTGDGYPDVMQFNPNQGNIYVYRNNAYKPSTGAAPLLLKSARTPSGSLTTLKYAPSTSFPGKVPGMRWLLTSLTTDPMPDSSDIRSPQMTTTYSYTNPRYDWPNKEWRGYAWVDEFRSDGRKIHREFNYGNGNQFTLAREAVLNAAGSIMTDDYHTWTDEVIDANIGYYRTRHQQTTSQRFEGQATMQSTRVTYTYDQYGNITLAQYHGDIAVSGDEKYVHTTYNVNTAANILHTPSVIETRDSNNSTVLARTRTYYDAATALGTAPTKGLPTKVESWLDTNGSYLASTFQYDSFGNVTHATDAKGNPTVSVFDSAGIFQTQTTNALNQTTTYVYDQGTGNLLSQTDPNGYQVDYEYDAFGRITKEIQPYDSAAYPTKLYTYEHDQIAPEHIKLSYRQTAGQPATADMIIAYDGLGHIIQTRQSNQSNHTVVDSYFDEHGRLLGQSTPYFAAVSDTATPANESLHRTYYIYDQLDRVIQFNSADYKHTYYTYLPGRVEETNPNGVTYATLTDGYGRTKAVNEDTSGLNLLTTYVYNNRDELISVTDPLGVSLTFEYNSLGRMTREVDPNRGTKTFQYDAIGNITRIEDGNGNLIVANSYDALSRVTAADYPGSADDTSMVYDRETIGTLSQESNSYSTSTYLYDNRLRLTSKSLQSGSENITTEYMYDSANQMTTQAHNGGQSIVYQYVAGMLEGINGFVSNIDYSEYGLSKLLSFANGLTANWSYDPHTGRVTTHTVGSQLAFGYSYDDIGNVTQITEPEHTFNYIYDALDRLISGVDSLAGLFNVQYAYDAGNRITQVNHDDGSLVYSYTSAQPHAVDQITGVEIIHQIADSTSTPGTPVPTATPTPGQSGAPGVQYAYYEIANMDVLPDFSNYTPVSTGTSSNFSLSMNHREDDFAFKFTGCLNVPGNGVYTFYTISDDGSALYIDGQQVVNNDGLHGMQERSGNITLTQGQVPIEVTFFERGGGQVLEVKWQGPAVSGVQVMQQADLTQGNCSTGNQTPTPTPSPTNTPVPTPSPTPGGSGTWDEVIEDFENGSGGWMIGGNAVCLVPEPIPGGNPANTAAAMCYNNPSGFAQKSLSDNWSDVQKVKLTITNVASQANCALFIGTGNQIWQEAPTQVIPSGSAVYEYDLAGWVTNLQSVVYYGLKCYTAQSTEQKVYIDDITLVHQNSTLQSATSTQCEGGLTQEAELGKLTGMTAINGTISSDTNNWSPSTNAVADYCVTVTRPGTYQLHAWVKAPDQQHNSFWVTINDGLTYKWSIPVSENITQHRIADQDSVNPIAVYLDQGRHRIQFFAREAGTHLDKWQLMPVNGLAATAPDSPDIRYTVRGSLSQIANPDQVAQIHITHTNGNMYKAYIDHTAMEYVFEELVLGSYTVSVTYHDGNTYQAFGKIQIDGNMFIPGTTVIQSHSLYLPLIAR